MKLKTQLSKFFKNDSVYLTENTDTIQICNITQCPHEIAAVINIITEFAA
jgi:hypothetical protein